LLFLDRQFNDNKELMSFTLLDWSAMVGYLGPVPQVRVPLLDANLGSMLGKQQECFRLPTGTTDLRGAIPILGGVGYFSFPPLPFCLTLPIAAMYNQSVGHGICVPAPSHAQRAAELVL
jgi:hypothetical protein